MAQLHSGGGGGAYAPDFAVHLHSTYFVVEVKALDKDFSPNDRMQPVNYVNALGRRWAVLTHSIAAVAIILVFILHVYAAFWTRGTLRAMTRGTVTGGWAYRHHRKWLRELAGRRTRGPAE